ncbi:MAG: hypothetical protein ICV86_17855, partial [Microcoleus sp. T3-bin5]|nr:hypothetical protein [Microcoleus sp. T3-bin5]
RSARWRARRSGCRWPPSGTRWRRATPSRGCCAAPYRCSSPTSSRLPPATRLVTSDSPPSSEPNRYIFNRFTTEPTSGGRDTYDYPKSDRGDYANFYEVS